MLTEIDVGQERMRVFIDVFRATRASGRAASISASDMNCSDHLQENNGPIGAMFHGISTHYCMATSLAQGGAGLGTLGLHERRLREYAAVAGFDAVRLAFQDPFNKLYELR